MEAPTSWSIYYDSNCVHPNVKFFLIHVWLQHVAPIFSSESAVIASITLKYITAGPSMQEWGHEHNSIDKHIYRCGFPALMHSSGEWDFLHMKIRIYQITQLWSNTFFLYVRVGGAGGRSQLLCSEVCVSIIHPALRGWMWHFKDDKRFSLICDLKRGVGGRGYVLACWLTPSQSNEKKIKRVWSLPL